MKICRFNNHRLGVVADGRVADVTAALEVLPAVRWPLPPGDLLIAHLARVRRRIARLLPAARRYDPAKLRLLSPVANPTKIIGAPINYAKHVAEAAADAGIHHGKRAALRARGIGEWGLFLKANSALVGPSEGVARRFPDRRTDHEVELAVIIGRRGSDIPAARALDHVAGYAIGLDMVVRGPEVQSFRKSIDTYAVLGPWLVTRDEIADPNALDLEISVGRRRRQRSNTRHLIFGVERLIEFASSFYTLHPGDIIMTGTPEGVAPVRPGNVMHARIQGIGSMRVAVRGAR